MQSSSGQEHPFRQKPSRRMSPRDRRCLVTSVIAHFICFIAWIVLPLIWNPSPKANVMPTFEFVPAELVDQALAPTMPTPKPQRTPTPKKTQPDPAPRKPEPKVVKPPSKPEPKPQPKKTVPRKPAPKKTTPKPKTKISNKLSSKVSSQTPSKKNNPAKSQIADSLRRLQNQSKNLESAVSKMLTPVTTARAVGPNGSAFASYASKVRDVYNRAWSEPGDIDNSRATVSVEVIILKSGKVKSARITRNSGISVLDQSIRSALDRVTFVAPFPKGATDGQRSFVINFSLKASR